MADQPTFDKYRAADKFERHPSKTNKTVTKCVYTEKNNDAGLSTLQAQIDIAAEQGNDSEDGL